MPPKPFPCAFSVGVDICRIDRIRGVLGSGEQHYALRWGSKVFNRLEWPNFKTKFDFLNKHQGGASKSDPFVTWVAGRWAAKEAAIKAHSSRKLVLRDISIFPRHAIYGGGLKPNQPLGLIDPPRRAVIMTKDVAAQRGLRGFARPEPREEVESNGAALDDVETATAANTQQFYYRKLLVREEDRQVVEISISHEADYAMAVCLAPNTPEEGHEELEPVIDDGTGPPIHEPEFQDLGYFELSDMARETMRRKYRTKQGVNEDTASQNSE